MSQAGLNETEASRQGLTAAMRGFSIETPLNVRSDADRAEYERGFLLGLQRREAMLKGMVPVDFGGRRAVPVIAGYGPETFKAVLRDERAGRDYDSAEAALEGLMAAEVKAATASMTADDREPVPTKALVISDSVFDALAEVASDIGGGKVDSLDQAESLLHDLLSRCRVTSDLAVGNLPLRPTGYAPVSQPQCDGADFDSVAPNTIGHVSVTTGRVCVRAADYAASDLNGDEPAYLFDRVAEEMGLECWRMIDSIDFHTHPSNSCMDVWFTNGTKPFVAGMEQVIYLQADAAKRLAAQLPSKLAADDPSPM